MKIEISNLDFDDVPIAKYRNSQQKAPATRAMDDPSLLGRLDSAVDPSAAHGNQSHVAGAPTSVGQAATGVFAMITMDELHSEIAAVIACSPAMTTQIAALSGFVDDDERERFNRLLRLAMAYAYSAGMKAGAAYMVPTK